MWGQERVSQGGEDPIRCEKGQIPHGKGIISMIWKRQLYIGNCVPKPLRHLTVKWGNGESKRGGLSTTYENVGLNASSTKKAPRLE